MQPYEIVSNDLEHVIYHINFREYYNFHHISQNEPSIGSNVNQVDLAKQDSLHQDIYFELCVSIYFQESNNITSINLINLQLLYIIFFSLNTPNLLFQ